MKTHDFDSLIRRCHDYLYANSPIKTPEALQAEVAKIVMVLVATSRKMIDRPPLFSIEDAEWARNSYEILRAKKPDWDWGPFELDDKSIGWVIESLREVDFENVERDFLGDALEVMRGTDAKRLGGQFFTDQRVTSLTLKLLQYDPLKHDFLDICAGTGGFLIPAAKSQVSKKLCKPIYGIEIDPKISKLAQSTLSHLSKLKSIQVFHADSLQKSTNWNDAISRKIKYGAHLRLASNPPFGTKIKIRDLDILGQFDLAKKWRFTDNVWESSNEITARAPELLFVERNLQLAKPGEGLVGLVLPYQILSGPQLGYIRQWLIRNAQIVAIVDLPSDTFQPWTGTKTSIVIAKRRLKPLTDNESISSDPDIFMSISEHIGHDRRGKPIFDQDGLIKQDLSEIEKSYEEFRKNKVIKSHSNSFTIKASRILENSDLRLNAAFYNPSSSSIIEKLQNSTGKEFKTVKLKNLVDDVFCPGRFKRDYQEQGGVPFLGGSNISQYTVITEKALSINDPHLSELKVKSGWILVTRSGSTGIVSRVPASWGGHAISEHVIRIVPKLGKEKEANYIEAFLRSSWGQEMLNMGIFGSVIDEITPEYIANLPIPIPVNQKSMNEISKNMELVLESRESVIKNLELAQNNLLGIFSKLL